MPSPSNNAVAAASSQRLGSLDALRGFDMLWILGLDELLPKVFRLLHFSWMEQPTRIATEQLDHAKWDGMHFEDLIFPLFVFMVGVSIVFSLSKALSQRNRWLVALRIVPRACLLFLLGLINYGGFDQSMHHMRWLGVLQRIAICYCITAALFCVLRTRYLAVIAVALLVGYWLLMAYIPVPGVGRGSFAEGKNLANHIDQQYLGGRKWENKDHDPEGLLSTLPAIATCLLGVFAGTLLKDGKSKPYMKVLMLIGGGAVLAGVGYAWGFLPSPIQFPVIKKIWTSSFVLLAGGYSAMLLGLFYLIIDVLNFRVWAVPFLWIGTNAITLYVLEENGVFGRAAELLVGGGKYDQPIFGSYQELITLTVAIIFTLALARFLYRRGVFIRV